MKYLCYFISLFAAAACTPSDDSGRPDAQSSINEERTREVLDHHWVAFNANNLEETMEDYTEESVLITPNATYRGLEEIRNNFVRAFKSFPKDSTTFTLDQSLAIKDVGYILWKARTPTFNLSYATDTFIIHDGKIIRQTYAGYSEPKPAP
jgi:hypothetical protein